MGRFPQRPTFPPSHATGLGETGRAEAQRNLNLELISALRALQDEIAALRGEIAELSVAVLRQ